MPDSKKILRLGAVFGCVLFMTSCCTKPAEEAMAPPPPPASEAVPEEEEYAFADEDSGWGSDDDWGDDDWGEDEPLEGAAPSSGGDWGDNEEVLIGSAGSGDDWYDSLPDWDDEEDAEGGSGTSLGTVVIMGNGGSGGYGSYNPGGNGGDAGTATGGTARILSQGAEIKTLRLSQDFPLADYKRQNNARVIPLFTLDAQQKLRVLTSEDAYEDSSNGERLIALVWKTDKVGEKDATAS